MYFNVFEKQWRFKNAKEKWQKLKDKKEDARRNEPF